MNIIEDSEAEQTDNQITDIDRLRLEAIQLLFDVPKEGLDSVLRHIKTVIEMYGQDNTESTEDDNSEKGTLRGLAKLAMQKNIEFEPTDLSERVNEYMRTGFVEDYERRLKHDEEPHTD